MDKNAKVYVAGHRGMVGSAIINALQNAGFQNILTANSAQLDLRRQNETEQFFQTEKPDYVFLAAAKVGGIIANNTFRAEFIYDNLMIEANIIHASHLSGVKKLLFLGSSCIYPKLAPQPLNESYLLTGELESTNEPYAIAKIAGIKMCDAYRHQYQSNFISVMPTNLFGLNDNYDLQNSHVLPALIRKMHLGKLLSENNWEGISRDFQKHRVEGKFIEDDRATFLATLEKYGIRKKDKQVEVEIWGSGSPMREFLHANDLAEACLFLMQTYNEAGLVNIGTGIDISIKDLALMVQKVVNFEGNLFFNASKPDGTPRKLLDVSKLHQLGWSHKISLESGIFSVYETYLQP